ncbi:uncharacterized protein TNCV_2858251 [Trichonephila clavipes]|nr:uncharacterized protein TNCV_2858251 [Trichonephila clavipes]
MPPRRHFSTGQCSASNVKGVTRLSPHCYYPSLACPIPDLSPIEHIWNHLGRRVGHPTSLNELTANMERNVSTPHAELVCLNTQSHRIVHSR